LAEGQEHDRHRGGIVIHQLEVVDAPLDDVGHPKEARDDADEQDYDFMIAQVPLDPPRESVLDGRDHHLHDGKLGIQTQAEEHEEEHDCPELGIRHLGHRLGIHHEDHARTIADYVPHIRVLLQRQVAQRGEGKDAHQEAGDHVHRTHRHRVPQDIIIILVVAGEGDHGSEGDAQRVEILRGSVDPHIGVLQLRPLGPEEEAQTLGRPIQGHRPHHQDDDQDERKGGREVAHLRRRLDRLPCGKVDH